MKKAILLGIIIFLFVISGMIVFATTRQYFPGDVGIGTVNPATRLEVKGTASFTDVDGDGLKISPDTIKEEIRADLRINYIESIGGGGGNPIILKANKSLLYLGSDGNVGIGTAEPGEKLDVEGNIKLRTTGTATANTQYPSHQLLFDSSSWSTYYNGPVNRQWRIKSIGQNNYWGQPRLSFISDYDNVERMVIDMNTGYVGIGTTEPFAMLQVGSATTMGRIRIVHKGDGVDTAVLQLVDGKNNRSWNILNRESSNAFMLQSFDGGTVYRMPIIVERDSPTYTLYLKGNGRVGIGTAEPEGAISIAGSGLDGTMYQQFAIYVDSTNNVLFEAPKPANLQANEYDIKFGWRGGPSDALVIQGNTRRVGIGTPTPRAKFDVGREIGFATGEVGTNTECNGTEWGLIRRCVGRTWKGLCICMYDTDPSGYWVWEWRPIMP